MRDRKRASPQPTAGTEGGGTGCLHLWSEAFRSITKTCVGTLLFWVDSGGRGSLTSPAGVLLLLESRQAGKGKGLVSWRPGHAAPQTPK